MLQCMTLTPSAALSILYCFDFFSQTNILSIVVAVIDDEAAADDDDDCSDDDD